MTILLVDAPDGDASVLASALRVEGFEVEIVSTAAEARRAAADGAVSLAVVDLMLRGDTPAPSSVLADSPRPDGESRPPPSTSPSSAPPTSAAFGQCRNGLELARELRALNPAMRVLLTSAYLLSERQLERADCGVSGFIPKPYDLAEVVAFIRAKVSAPPSSRRLWHAEPGSGVIKMPRSLRPATSEAARVRR